jgi:hypothetical protein
MTFEEAKDQVAKNLKYSNWSELESACFYAEDALTFSECVSAAADLFATAKAAEAWEEGYNSARRWNNPYKQEKA